MENLQQLALHSWWGGGEVERLRQTQGEGEREKEAFLRCPMDYAHPVLSKLQAALSICMFIYLWRQRSRTHQSSYFYFKHFPFSSPLSKISAAVQPRRENPLSKTSKKKTTKKQKGGGKKSLRISSKQ